MKFDFLRFHDEVDVLAGREVEVRDGGGGDVGGQSGASVGLIGAPDPDGGSVNVHFGDAHGNDVAGAAVWCVEVDGDRRWPEQCDRRSSGIEVPGPGDSVPQDVRITPVR